MKKSDIIIALATGEVVALFFMDLLKILFAKGGIVAMSLYSLPVVFPILSVFCLWIAYLIGKKFLFIFQLAKFLLIGALATIFDLGTLSIFIDVFAISAGIYYSVFKGISFIVATVAKYFFDKFWAFEKKETGQMAGEFTKFFLVTLVGLVINVAIASFVVAMGPQFNLPKDSWAKIGGIVAVLFTFAWNFVAYKFIVFKK
jgi:putative flippase GtrA